MADAESKRCTVCDSVKPITAFSRHSGRKDGINSQCKSCHREYRARHRDRDLACMARYRASHPDTVRRGQLRWYEANKQRETERNREYRRANPDKVRAWKAADYARNIEANRARSRRYYEANKASSHAYSAQWAKAHPSRVRQFVRNWELANPESVIAKSNRRRAKQASAPGRGVTRSQWKQIAVDALGLCAYCGEKKKLTMDHIDPIALGGAHDVENVAAACKFCNQSKGDSPLVVWLAKRRAA